MKRIEIPLWFFNIYWLVWFLASAAAVAWNWRHLLWPLVIAFIAVETLGILFTVKDAGTLTDTTAKYVPEDFTFILMGLMLWRLSQWLSTSGWVVWALGAWLLQHFIVHYQTNRNVVKGWNAPYKLKLWFEDSVRPRSPVGQGRRMN